MIVNVDGWIAEIPDGVETLEFRSGDAHMAGALVARDASGERVQTRHICAQYKLVKPWYEEIKDVVA